MPTAALSPAQPAIAPPTVVDDPVEQVRFTQWVVGGAGERLGESALQLSGLHCAACAGLIESALAKVPGVRAVQVGASAQRATVRWDPEVTRPSALIAAVRAAGYDAVPDATAPARRLRRDEHRQALWRLFVSGFCAMQVMMMATPAYVAGPGELAPDMRQLLAWGGWLLTLPVMLFSAAPFFQGAWRGLRLRRIGMDVPVALGVLITFVASSGAAFDPTGPFGHEVYFDSLAMFVSFLLGARYLELLARHRAAEALEASLSRLPETALRLAPDGSAEEVSVQRLRPQDQVRVPLGQAFPADGELLEGLTQADESLLSGEARPVPKAPGDELVAGSINLGAPVRMRVLRVGPDTRLEAIVSMMRSAMSQRPASAALADRWAAPFLWTVLLLAAGAAAAWSVIDPGRAVWVAVSVLIVTCPCALSLAAPATLVAAARGLAREGVLVQRLDALATLARVQQLFFDKTGTLTESQPQWRATGLTAAGTEAFGDAPAALRCAASLAAWSQHPQSAALVTAAAAMASQLAATAPRPAPIPAPKPALIPALIPAFVPEPIPAPLPAWSDVHEIPGRGLQARDAQGRLWRLGSAAWAVEGTAIGASAGQAQAEIDSNGAVEGQGVLPPASAGLTLACDGCALAGFEMADLPRAGAAEAVRALRADGLRVSLLSGDTPARTEAIAKALGLSDAQGGASPTDKLAAVAAAQAAGRVVAMVGDGINDAPVLARADVSLAMGQGALVSRSQADAVLSSNRLQDIVLARRRAVRAMAIVRQNLAWAAAYNALCIPLALAGWLPPWAAGLGMAGSSLLVTLNALRAAR
jgi:Cu2+-exporting ATPase